MGNGFTGVNIGNGCQSNTVGGGIGARNIISGNSNLGIIVEDTNTAANIIQGNTVGLDATSTLAIPNQYAGVYVFNTASFNQIGGTTLGSANLIASNGSYGVQIDDVGTTNDFNVPVIRSMATRMRASRYSVATIPSPRLR